MTKYMKYSFEYRRAGEDIWHLAFSGTHPDVGTDASFVDRLKALFPGCEVRWTQIY